MDEHTPNDESTAAMPDGNASVPEGADEATVSEESLEAALEAVRQTSDVLPEILESAPKPSELSEEERALYEHILDRELSMGMHLPTAQQLAAAFAAMALASPAMLGGMPVLPVTIDDVRRRQQEEILQQSDSSVGVHHSVQEAATSLSLSQRRLAAVTREVEGTHAHDISEADVVSAAKRVAAGEVSPRRQASFRAALGRVAVDSVDLFILLDDEAHDPDAYDEYDDYGEDAQEEGAEDDLEVWLAEFE